MTKKSGMDFIPQQVLIKSGVMLYRAVLEDWPRMPAGGLINPDFPASAVSMSAIGS